jgi:hypothetical protein
MRIWRLSSGLCVLAFAASCGGGDSHGSANGGATGGPPAGYVRFTSTAVTIAPGTSGQWYQWVQAPLDHDVNVADIQGRQGPGGHHAVLYSTTDVQPVGTLRAWQDSNIVTSHFLGGIGGEGGSALKLPEGAVFRLRAGQALAIQMHYLNTTAQPLPGTTQLDVKFATPAPTDHLVSLVTNTALTFNVPAQNTAHVDISCKLGQDVSVVMTTNHMHQWGTSVQSVLVDGSGAQTVLKNDPVWNSEWTTNPDFTKMTVAAPLVLKAGETIKTSCDWSNTTNQSIMFPAEMCVFIGFYLGDADVGCIDSGTFGPD